jgi:hypothetical protein
MSGSFSSSDNLDITNRRKPLHLQRIQDSLLTLEGFQIATSLDLNMGHYLVELSCFSKSLCVPLFLLGENMSTTLYQWAYVTVSQYFMKQCHLYIFVKTI